MIELLPSPVKSVYNCHMGIKRIIQFGQAVWAGLNHLLWPEVCINCRQSICISDNHLCQKCWQELTEATSGDYCPGCGKDVSRYALVHGKCSDCQDQSIYFDKICRAGFYSHALRRMILSFKLHGRTELDLTLGFLANSALQGSEFYEEVDFFVPVPLHWTRRLNRGFNQSLILAKMLKHPTAKLNTDLVRTRNTRAQVTMESHTSRKKNVANAFAVRMGHKFQGANICLVDDIKTSGATLNECAKVLKEAGASKVFTLVLAVAGQDK